MIPSVRRHGALMLRALALLALLALTAGVRADRLVLFAGGGSETGDAAATKAKLVQPFGIDFDKDGNAYIVEMTNAGGRVAKVDRAGLLTVVAGDAMESSDDGDVPAKKASFKGMHGLAIAPGGRDVFLADTYNARIRKYDPSSDVISTFAGMIYPREKPYKYQYSGDGGPARQAKFSGVYCVAFHPAGDKLYAADLENRRVRVVDLKSGTVDLVAGNGTKGLPKDGADAKDSPLVDPRAVAVDKKGNVYVLERNGNALRVVDSAGKIRTVVGTGAKGNDGDDGPALKATLNDPKHLCVDHDGDVVIADSGNHVIRKYSPATGKIVRIAGTGTKGNSGDGGDALTTPLNSPHGVTVHPNGTLYIVDSNNGRVLRLEK